MQIIPAIDLLDGNVVRLERGDYTKVKIYSKSPGDVAKRWKEEGAKLLHVVDLDGARDGEPKNLDAIKNILKATKDMKTELGGGVRNLKTLGKIFDMGVYRAVLGTAAITDEDFAKEAISAHGAERIAFSLDMKDEKVLMRGWKMESGCTFHALLTRFQYAGLTTIIYTDIMRDGLMKGVDGKRTFDRVFEIYNTLVSTNLEIIVSGGVSSMTDIRELAELKKTNNITNDVKRISGIIIGKALYEGKIKLSEAIRAG